MLPLYRESNDKLNTNNKMADNINLNKLTGKHSFVSVKKKAWHGLGTIVENTMTSKECIEIAGLNYNVIKAPNYVDMDWQSVVDKSIIAIADIKDEDLLAGERLKNRLILNPKSFSTIRTDTREILGTVGSDYVVVNNKEAFEFFDTITGTQEAIYETAGALGRGECIFMTAKIPSIIKLGDSTQEDNVERYIVLSNTHDGSRSLEAFITTVRVVCNNTLAAARNSASCRFRIRHTKNAKNRIVEAREVLNLETKIIEAFAFNAKFMSELVITNDDALNMIGSVYYSKEESIAINKAINTSHIVNLNSFISTQKVNVIQSVYGHFKKGPGSDLVTAENTVWGVYNAVSSYYQNEKTYGNPSDKMNSILYGDAYTKVTKAYNLASDLVLETSL